MKVEKIMDRKKLGEFLHAAMDTGLELMKKKSFDQGDHARLKTIRTMGTFVNAAVSMVQQETAQQRIAVVVERMKQLGYSPPKGLTGGTT